MVSEGDEAGATDILRHVSSNENFPSEERLQGAKRRYSLGEAGASDLLREEALIRMLRTDGVPLIACPAILRTLMAMAMKRDDKSAALKHLEDVTAIDKNDAQASPISRSFGAISVSQEHVKR